MSKLQQIPLFKLEVQQPPVATKIPQATITTGLIQRQLDELETCTSANWIARTAKLRFQRKGSDNE